MSDQLEKSTGRRKFMKTIAGGAAAASAMSATSILSAPAATPGCAFTEKTTQLLL